MQQEMNKCVGYKYSTFTHFMYSARNGSKCHELVIFTTHSNFSIQSTSMHMQWSGHTATVCLQCTNMHMQRSDCHCFDTFLVTDSKIASINILKSTCNPYVFLNIWNKTSIFHGNFTFLVKDNIILSMNILNPTISPCVFL